MKSVIPGLVIAAALFSSNAYAIDVADADSLQTFVTEAYPRISSFNPVQDPELLKERVRFFATQEAFDSYLKSKTDDGTMEVVYGKGAIVLDEIVSKVSVYDRRDGDWKAEFVARHKSFGDQEETAECVSVTVELVSLPLAPGSFAAGITSISTKPAKVKCD